MARHPYENRPDYAYWRRAVADADDLDPMVAPPFTLAPDDRVATAGSCFAQHIGRHLRAAGFQYLDAETAPDFLGEEAATRLNFGLYSARYGNIYTPRQLLQLFERAYGRLTPRENLWRDAKGAFLDPFRPSIQPGGYTGEGELARDRERHFHAVRTVFETLDVFVFTLGLTEAWRSREDGAVFPVCPGVVGGTFDKRRHEFVNFDVEAIVADMRAFITALRGVNPSARIILTVSPVPLMATAEDRHVLTSTVYSKSVLRVACEMLTREPGAAYFPSYEIIASGFAGSYFGLDKRSVTEAGVEHVMRVFSRHFLKQPLARRLIQKARALVMPPRPAPPSETARIERAFQVMCDEEALDMPKPAKGEQP